MGKKNKTKNNEANGNVLVDQDNFAPVIVDAPITKEKPVEEAPQLKNDIVCQHVKYDFRTHEFIPMGSIEKWENVKKSALHAKRHRVERPNSPWRELWYIDHNKWYFVDMTPHSKTPVTK